MGVAAVARKPKKASIRIETDDVIFERQAMICKAFANPIRLKILDMISQGECPAADIQAATGISNANLSQHFAILNSAGVLKTHRDGKQMMCVLAIPEVKQACLLIRKVLQAQVEGARNLPF